LTEEKQGGTTPEPEANASVADQASEAVRADEDPDENEPDHRGDAEAGEQRDDDTRGAEYHERIGQQWGDGCVMHFPTMAGGS
jgi:hypothetical protein